LRNPFRKRDKSTTTPTVVAKERELEEAFVTLCGQWPPPCMSKDEAIRLGIVDATGIAVERSQAAIDAVFTPEVAVGDRPLDLDQLKAGLPEFALPHLDTAEQHSQALPDQEQGERAISLISAERANRIRPTSASGQ
jgi:hypothetical protein